MQVGVLGATELRRAGDRVDLGARKQRALLAALALHRGRAVPVDAIVDLLWGDTPPDGVAATLHSYVARLRRSLEPAREQRAPASLLVTVGRGYALQLPADTVDAARFDAVVTELHHRIATPDLPVDELTECVQRLDAALDLWRGTPFLELGDVADAVAERTRLEELRLLALEDRAVAQLGLGSHARVAGELEALTAAHPLRERLWALRALALTRARRQADALEVLREVRELLVDELGLEPGPELRELQAAVLRQDPALEWAPRAVTRTTTTAPAPRSKPGAAPLVGRAAELAALVDLLDLAQTGVPAYAALTGDPGIGKTRLAAELVAEATHRGVLVLEGRCSQDDGAPPLWPWAAVLGALGEEVPDPGPADRRDEGAQFRSWERIASAVVSAAAEATVLVVLDDLHWADESSLRVLRLLVETTRDARVAVLGTWRSHPQPTGALADLAETLARRHALRLQLPGLDSTGAAAVVEAVAHTRPSPVQAEALTRRTDGNPFFLVEYARLAGEGGDLAALLAEDEPPTAVHDVLVRRVARLPDPTRDALRTAAVVGREFDVATLRTVSGHDDETVLDLLEPARVAGLVREDGIDRWAFAHALVRDTLYASLPASRRARAHARVAAALDLPGRETERARHWLAAGPASAPQAWRAAVDAARSTRRVHAHDRSVDLLTSALAAMDSDPAATANDRHDVLMELLDAYRWTGEWSGLIDTEVTAVRVARETGDLHRTAAAASAMTLGLWHSADFGEQNDEIVAALRECLDGLPDADGPARCRTLLSLANEQFFHASFQQRESLVDEALAMARRLGDPDLLLDALLVAHIALFCARTVERRLALTTEAVQLARSTGNEHRLVVAMTLRAVVLGELGRVDELRDAAADAFREARRLRHQYALLILNSLELPWLAMAGDFEEGEQRVAGVQRLAELMHGDIGDEDLLTALVMGLWRGTSRDVAPSIMAMDRSRIPFSATVGVCLLRGDDIEGARAYVAEHPIDLDHDTWFSPMAWAHGAEVALGLGDPDLAARAYERLVPLAGRSVSAGAHNASGPADAFLALAAAAAGRRDDARTHADRAEELMAQWRIPLAATWLRGLRGRHGF